jgi:hypothetical protein
MHARVDEFLNLGERLRALPPAPDAAADAWPQVQARIARRHLRRVRSARVGVLAAAAAVATFALVTTVRLGESPAVPGLATEPTADLPADPVLEDLRARSQMLEAALAAMPARPSVERADMAVPIEALEAQAQWLDYEISVADVHSRTPEARRLWRDRVEVMNSLVQLRYVEAQRDWH